MKMDTGEHLTRKRSFLLGIMSVLSLLTTSVSSSSATEPPRGSSDGSTIGVTFSEYQSFSLTSGPSRVTQAADYWHRTEDDESWYCDSFSGTGCDAFDRTTEVNAMLMAGVCALEDNSYCIDRLVVKDSNGKVYSARFVRFLDTEGSNGKRNWNLPKGYTNSVWETDSTNPAAKFLLVNTLLNQTFDPDARKFVSNGFSVSINPFEFYPSNLLGPIKRLNNYPNGNRVAGTTFKSNGNVESCPNTLFVDSLNCGSALPLDKEVTFEIAIKVPTDVGGWFQSNLENLNVKVHNKPSYQLLTFSATPGLLPGIRTVVPTEILKKQKSLEWINKKTIVSSLGHGQFTSGNTSDLVKVLAGYLNETPTFERYVWTIQNASLTNSASAQYSTNPFKLKQCMSDNPGLIGILSTNAMSADPTPPTNKKGFLEYQVTGLHYRADGQTLNIGKYSMLMRYKFAKCIYDWKTVPKSSSVSVVNEEGEKVTATATLTTRGGWLDMRVAGFTYSTKKIRLKVK